MTLLLSEFEGLVRAKQFIDVHFAENIDVRELCAISGLYPHKLYKAFKRKYKTTIYQYQLQLRMEKAKELIMTDIPAKAVAIEIGYRGTSTRFWQQFKKHFGISPTVYRMQHCAENFVVI